MKGSKVNILLILFFSISFLNSGCAQQNAPSQPGQFVDLTTAAEKTINTVVHINAEMLQKHSMWDNFFQDPFFSFFNFGQPQQQRLYQAYGSGVIITKDGYIVTNNHVVEGAQNITVTLNDKRKFTATIIGTDAACDLAVLKIEANNLQAITYGNSDNVRIGEWVLAVGNPYNLNSTVTAGIISAKTRNLNILGQNTSVESFLQTDAAVNSGNSGGALVNTNGELIGVNAAIASNTGSYAGYSFAIPVNMVKKIVDDLIKYGKVQRVNIGASFLEIDNAKALELNLKEIKGIQIIRIADKGSLSNTKIKEGDILLAIDGHEINSLSELKELLEQHRPGDKVKLTILQNQKEIEVNLTLKNKRGTTDIITADDFIVTESLGAEFIPIDEQTKARYRVNNGLKIKKLHDGILKQAGISEGYIITAIDKKPVASIKDVERILEDKKGSVLVEGFYMNGIIYYYNIVL
jgi:Do/DeqQ family serine protease